MAHKRRKQMTEARVRTQRSAETNFNWCLDARIKDWRTCAKCGRSMTRKAVTTAPGVRIHRSCAETSEERAAATLARWREISQA